MICQPSCTKPTLSVLKVPHQIITCWGQIEYKMSCQTRSMSQWIEYTHTIGTIEWPHLSFGDVRNERKPVTIMWCFLVSTELLDLMDLLGWICFSIARKNPIKHSEWKSHCPWFHLYFWPLAQCDILITYPSQLKPESSDFVTTWLLQFQTGPSEL